MWDRMYKDAMCGGRSVLRGTASLGGATSCGVLRFVIAHDGGTLTGHVSDKDGNPIPDAYVAIIPESAATEAEMSAVMNIRPDRPERRLLSERPAAGKVSRAGGE